MMMMMTIMMRIGCKSLTFEKIEDDNDNNYIMRITVVDNYDNDDEEFRSH